jgi:predicted secreted protein
MGWNWLHRDRKETPMDARTGRIVVVIHCVLNQNVRDFGAAVYPGYTKRLLDILLEHDVGIFQLPCPEMQCLGLLRSRPKGFRIWDVLDTPCGRRCCRSLGRAVADQLQEHTQNNHRILGIVGGDKESPGCAVHLSKRKQERDTGYRLDRKSVV